MIDSPLIQNSFCASVIKESIKNWNGNPFYFRHELKEVRTYIHRQFRHLNKQNLKKGRDYEKEPKTNGWETY